MTPRRRKKKSDRAGMRAGGSGGDRAVERRRGWAVSGHPAAWGLVAARRPSGFAATRVRAGRDRQTADALSSGHWQDPRQRGGLSDQCRLASLAQRATLGGLGQDRKSPSTRNAPP